MYCKFGEDMLVQILSSLPPKALMRFKCVSKWWYAMISSPSFVAKHLSNSKHNNLSTSVLLKRFVEKPNFETVLSLLNFCNDNEDGHDNSFLAGVEDIQLPLHMSPEYRWDIFTMIGHCDGIICLLLDYSMVLFLWNPAIQELKLLPRPPYPPLFFPNEEFTNALGFGYDPKSKDYKVINIRFSGWREAPYSDESEFYEIYDTPKVAIYTLATDSWREIKTGSLETETTILRPEKFQIYFKGMCFWSGREQHKEMDAFREREEEFIRDVIILFDTSEEEFHDVLLPESLYDLSMECFYMRLLVWNESIALFGLYNGPLLNYGPNNISFGMWVMDEFGGPKGVWTWTKHLTFELTEKPLTFWKTDEILMVDRYGHTVSYNLNTKKLNYLPIQRPSDDFEVFGRLNYFAAVVYVHSIVSILGGNKATRQQA